VAAQAAKNLSLNHRPLARPLQTNNARAALAKRASFPDSSGDKDIAAQMRANCNRASN
jgi:hypothetical protein